MSGTGNKTAPAPISVPPLKPVPVLIPPPAVCAANATADATSTVVQGAGTCTATATSTALASASGSQCTAAAVATAAATCFVTQTFTPAVASSYAQAFTAAPQGFCSVAPTFAQTTATAVASAYASSGAGTSVASASASASVVQATNNTIAALTQVAAAAGGPTNLCCLGAAYADILVALLEAKSPQFTSTATSLIAAIFSLDPKYSQLGYCFLTELAKDLPPNSCTPIQTAFGREFALGCFLCMELDLP
eukprot:jgi/Astpho2/7142/Aster-08467